jgi:hypothetical protein
VQTRSWTTHFIYKKVSIKTTWKLRLGIAVCLALLAGVTRSFWIPGVGKSLVCSEPEPYQIGRVDAILVDDLDPNYLLFERAASLHAAGLGSTVLVTLDAPSFDESSVATGVVEVMARVARLTDLETIPFQESEPISLNAAYQVRESLTKRHIHSVVVVTPGFRSRRSSLVYGAVLGRAGIKAYCVPVFGMHTPETWAKSWHGIQEIVEQFVKLQYYRFYVLPVEFLKHSTERWAWWPAS